MNVVMAQKSISNTNNYFQFILTLWLASLFLKISENYGHNEYNSLLLRQYAYTTF